MQVDFPLDREKEVLMRRILLGLTIALATHVLPASAQSTDGYHAIQVLPVVVETATFVSRIVVRNPLPDRSLTLAFTYVPAQGTSQLTPIQCPNYTLYSNHTFESLRAICPSLPSGSQFGILYVRQIQSQTSGESATAEVVPFSMYSRVSNSAGNGFSVEAFPAHAFTSARSVVSGLRRKAATVDSPAFQTNCFIGNLNDITPDPNPVATQVDYLLFDQINQPIGAGAVTLVPGQVVRLLDVFYAAGASEWDFDNARIDFVETGDGEPALVTFCTVQDNTSFGADFRIGKPEQGSSHALPGIFFGGQDDHVLRNSTLAESITLSEGAGATSTRAFSLGPGALINTHLFYFRHPDYVQCELVDPATGVRATPTLGLEMRLLASDGTGQGVNEVFLKGTEPTQQAAAKSSPSQFFKFDQM